MPKGAPSEAATPYSTTEPTAFAPAATPPIALGPPTASTPSAIAFTEAAGASAPEALPPAPLRATPSPAAPASEHGIMHAEHAERGSDMANSASVKRRTASLKNSQRGLKPTSIATSATTPVAISVRFASAGEPASKSGSERVSAREIPRPSAANKPPNRINGDTPIRLTYFVATTHTHIWTPNMAMKLTAYATLCCSGRPKSISRRPQPMIISGTDQR